MSTTPSVTVDLYAIWGKLEKAGYTVLRGVILKPGVFYFIYKDKTGLIKELLVEKNTVVYDRPIDLKRRTLFLDMKLPVTYEDVKH